MIKTLIFDLGKVIVPFDIERLKEFGKYGDLPPSKIKERFLAAPELRLYETGKVSSNEFYSSVRDKLGLQIEFNEFAAIWNGIFDLKPLISEPLMESFAMEHRLIVLSDTNELHFEFIRHNFPILGHFDDFCLSYETGFMKPQPESFAAALDKAGCAANECFFIDDKLDNVLGARNFGMKATQFINESDLTKTLDNLNR